MAKTDGRRKQCRVWCSSTEKGGKEVWGGMGVGGCLFYAPGRSGEFFKCKLILITREIADMLTTSNQFQTFKCIASARRKQFGEKFVRKI